MKEPNNPFEFDGLIDFMDKFPTEKSARDHSALIRWNGTPVCPHCGHEKVYTYSDGKRYKCASCKVQFTVKSGTVFEDSKIGMRKWFLCLYLMTCMKKGISSCELSRKLKVTQKTAWFMEHRLRHTLQTSSFELPAKGVVEAEETYCRRQREAQTQTCERHSGTLYAHQNCRAWRESRKDGVFARVTEDVKYETVREFIKENVAKGAILMTDEFRAYQGMGNIYDHRTVTHRYGDYASGIDNDTHCNGMENYWSHFKCAILWSFPRCKQEALKQVPRVPEFSLQQSENYRVGTLHTRSR